MKKQKNKVISLLLVLTLVTMLMINTATNVVYGNDVNLALYKTVTYVATEGSSYPMRSSPVSYVVDGKQTTAFAPFVSKVTDPERIIRGYVRIDLMESFEANCIILRLGNNNLKKTSIEICDSGEENWKTVYEGENLQLGNYTCMFKPQSIRYIKVNILDSNYTPGINEIEVYNTEDASVSDNSGISINTDEYYDADGSVFEDVIGTKYELAVQTLRSLKVINGSDDGMYHPEETVTRAELCKLIGAILGYEKNVIPYAGEAFSDVPETHWAYNIIHVLHSMGIVSGYEGNMFMPDKNVSVHEGVKMLVSALGYDIFAEQYGGYPVGYLVQAEKLGVLKNIMFEGNELNRGDVALIIYNSLNVNVVNAKIYNEFEKYEVNDDVTVLNLLTDGGKGEGVITATQYTSLSNQNGVSKGHVRINDELFELGNTNADELLGQYVDYYYADNNGTKRLISVNANNKKNSSLMIYSDDIIRSGPNELHYFVDSKDMTAYFNEDADVIYNGKAYREYSVKDFEIDEGSLLFLDNDGDEIYDVVFIRDVEVYVVDTISYLTRTITDKYNKLPLCFDNIKDENISIVKDGTKITFDLLEKGDVLNVMKSKSGDYVEVLATRLKIDGVITEYSVTDNMISVDGVIYDITKVLIDDLGDTKISIQPKPGKKQRLYLTADNKVAFIENIFDDTIFVGYLYKIAEEPGVDDKIVLKVYTEANEWEVLEANGKLLLDDKPIKSVDLMDSKNGLTRKIGDTYETNCQLIQYKKNDNNLVSYIDLANSIDDGFRVDKRDFYGRYRQGATAFCANGYTECFISEQTKVFCIPPDVDNLDLYRVLNNNAFVDGGRYTITTYKTDVDQITVPYVYFNDIGLESVSLTNPIIVVDKFIKCINVFGEELYQIFGFQKGVEVTYYIAEEDLNGRILDRGDIIHVGETVLSGDRITVFELRFDASQQNGYVDLGGDAYYQKMIYGEVLERNANYLTLKLDDGTVTTVNLIASYYYVVNKKRDAARVGSVDDLERGMGAFVLINNGLVYGTVMYY